MKREGYAGVVNLRHDGEPDQPLDTKAEGAKARALGMDYLNQPVGGAPLTEAAVEAVGAFLKAHEGRKVLVHCRKGQRAAVLVLLNRALAGAGRPPRRSRRVELWAWRSRGTCG